MLRDVAKGVHHGVGVLGADLQAEVALGLGRVQVVVGEALHGVKAGRPEGLEAEPVVEQAGAHPEDKTGIASRQDRPQNAVVVGRRRRPGELRCAPGVKEAHAARYGP